MFKITGASSVLRIARNLCIMRRCILYAIGIRKTGLPPRQESFMPLRSKWRIAGLTHRRLEDGNFAPRYRYGTPKRTETQWEAATLLRYRLNCSNLKVSFPGTVLVRHGFIYIGLHV